MSSVYFSCPSFTVRLLLNGNTIVEAAPIVRTFEGQTIDALTRWARTRFGGPIVVKCLTAPGSKHRGPDGNHL